MEVKENLLAAVSIIIPTYNEKENITKLVERIIAGLEHYDRPTEIVVVDDNSPDGTGKIIESLSLKNNSKNISIKLITRNEKSGLGSAIIKGFQNSRGRFFIVIDADLSHPPELIPQMVGELEKGYDLVIGSRYMPGGRVEGWTFVRRNISRVATWLSKWQFKLNVTDPMSGFFATKKESIAEEDFHAIGYKILLEILVRRKDLSVKEIPYTFVNRDHGKSKLGLNNIVDYVRLVRKL